MNVGANIYDSPMPQEVIGQIMTASLHAVETGQVQTVEFIFPRRSEFRHYEARIVASGANELVATVRNITEHKRAQEELRATAAALQESHANLQSLTGQLISAREEESKHLARELHDAFGQKCVWQPHLAQFGSLIWPTLAVDGLGSRVFRS